MTTIKKGRTSDAGRGNAHNASTHVPHPLSHKAARGDSSGLPERHKRGLPRIYRPLLWRSSRPNTPNENFGQLSKGTRRRVS
jgi:hypothetical protein